MIMKVTLSISPEEADALRASLDFIQSNSSLESGTLKMRLRGGRDFSLSIPEWLGLGYIIAKIDEAYEDNANRVHFAGACRVF